MLGFHYGANKAYSFGELLVAPQPKNHSHALEMDRAYNSDQWQVFGDGKENPSPQDVVFILTGLNRIDAAYKLLELQDKLSSATKLVYDTCELPVLTARVTEQMPIGDAGYKLKISFYPSQALWLDKQTGRSIPLL